MSAPVSTPKAIFSIALLIAFLIYAVWFFSTYPDEKRACEHRGGVMVQSGSATNGHGYVCVTPNK